MHALGACGEGSISFHSDRKDKHEYRILNPAGLVASSVRYSDAEEKIMDFIRTLFSTKGLLIGVYILIGVFANTKSPHVPATPNNIESIHSWVQYGISVLFWPLSLWQPTFTVGKWT